MPFVIISLYCFILTVLDFWERTSLCSPSWSQTCGGPSASAFPALELQLCNSTTPGFLPLHTCLLNTQLPPGIKAALPHRLCELKGPWWSGLTSQNPKTAASQIWKSVSFHRVLRKRGEKKHIYSLGKEAPSAPVTAGPSGDRKEASAVGSAHDGCYQVGQMLCPGLLRGQAFATDFKGHTPFVGHQH